MTGNSAPLSSMWVAKQCRRVCGCTGLVIPARRVDSRQACQTTLSVMGSLAFAVPAGEHPTVAPRQGAVVSAQLLAQLGTEGNFAGLAAFAMRDANDHALFVDVLGTELAQFGAAHAGVVQSHQ